MVLMAEKLVDKKGIWEVVSNTNLSDRLNPDNYFLIFHISFMKLFQIFTNKYFV